MSKRAIVAALWVGVAGMAGMLTPNVWAESDTNATIRVAGQLAKIDGKMLTIATTEGREITLIYTGATKISRAGANSSQPLKYEDLKVGQQVRAYYSNYDKAVFGVIIDRPKTATPAP